jgi:hypothetical protein
MVISFTGMSSNCRYITKIYKFDFNNKNLPGTIDLNAKSDAVYEIPQYPKKRNLYDTSSDNYKIQEVEGKKDFFNVRTLSQGFTTGYDPNAKKPFFIVGHTSKDKSTDEKGNTYYTYFGKN